MDTATTVRHFQGLDRGGVQFGRHLPSDLVTLLVLKDPRPRDRIEPHPDRPSRPQRSDAVRPVVHRDLPLAVHPPTDHVPRHQVPDPLQVPVRLLPRRVIGTTRVPQPGISLQTPPDIDDRIQLTLPAIQLVEAPLQLPRGPAAIRLRPLLAHPLGSLHDAVGLGPAWRVVGHGDAQARQPADQVGGQVPARAPRGAVVDPQSLGRPQRVKAWRKACCVAWGSTWVQRPRGENGRLQDGPRRLIDDPQPGDEAPVPERDQFGRVDLPGQVGLARPTADARRPDRRRGRPRPAARNQRCRVRGSGRGHSGRR